MLENKINKHTIFDRAWISSTVLLIIIHLIDIQYFDARISIVGWMLISGLKNMHSYIASVDFIIARGGYNTLTECLILKKPSLLMYETNNKEILHNISLLKKNNFCEIIYQSDFKKDINKKILNFVKYKKNKIFRNLVKKNFKSNGSKQIYKFLEKEIY